MNYDSKILSSRKLNITCFYKFDHKGEIIGCQGPNICIGRFFWGRGMRKVMMTQKVKKILSAVS